jgi:hypothetical protein
VEAHRHLIAVNSDVSSVNPLVAYYDIHRTIDLVLIDQQSVGKRSLHLTLSMQKREGRPFTSVPIIFERVPQIVPVTRYAKKRVSFSKINDISFYGTS